MYLPLTLVTILCLSLVSSDDVNTFSHEYDTIVVGLGSSGVTAAATLARAGRKVLGLEAQARIGGRVNTVPFGDGVVELGAEWIHGEKHSRSYDLAIANNVTLIPEVFNTQFYRSDGTIFDHGLTKELMTICLALAEEPTDVAEPLGEFITRNLMDYLRKNKPEVLKDKEFLEQFLYFMNLAIINNEAANDWNDVSTLSRYEELEGNQLISWHRHGYKTFFDLLLNTYNNGPGLSTLETKLNKEVTKIIWTKNATGNVRVECKDGDVYSASNVIVTVSIGVLKERHTSLFLPSLPGDKLKTIQEIPMGVVDKIIISFSERWWQRDQKSFGFMWKREDMRRVGKDDSWTTKLFAASSPMGASNALTFWISGDAAKLVETLPEELVVNKTMELLRRFLGTNITIPEPSAVIRTTWYSNPYTRGSYSYDSHSVVANPDCRAVLSRPLLDAAGEPRVLFAGEATDNTHFSTVHGASDTGYREAMRLLTKSKI